MSEVAALGERFAALMLECLSKHEIRVVRERNALHAASGLSVCATHDFCDANMVMDEAFRLEMGRPFLSDLEGDDDAPIPEPSDADCRLWGAAWNYAFRHHFGGR